MKIFNIQLSNGKEFTYEDAESFGGNQDIFD